MPFAIMILRIALVSYARVTQYLAITSLAEFNYAVMHEIAVGPKEKQPYLSLIFSANRQRATACSAWLY
jgi:hypothetical protein